MLCVVRGAMERLTEAFGFSEPDCRSVTRAVDEALTNIMRHSYAREAGPPDRGGVSAGAEAERHGETDLKLC